MYNERNDRGDRFDAPTYERVKDRWAQYGLEGAAPPQTTFHPEK